MERTNKEQIDSIKDHCTKLNRFNLKHVDLLEHAISKGIFDSKQLGYIGALKRLEENKDSVLGKSDFSKNGGGQGEKGKIINLNAEIKNLQGKVDASILKMQNSFVDKKIEIEKTYDRFQNLMGQVRNARSNTSNSKLEMMVEDMRQSGISINDTGSRRARKPELNQFIG